MKETSVELLIIGGGAAGMSAAVAATELGVKVLVAEARPGNRRKRSVPAWHFWGRQCHSAPEADFCRP